MKNEDDTVVSVAMQVRIVDNSGSWIEKNSRKLQSFTGPRGLNLQDMNVYNVHN